jgi:hypothetical protein
VGYTRTVFASARWWLASLGLALACGLDRESNPAAAVASGGEPSRGGGSAGSPPSGGSAGTAGSASGGATSGAAGAPTAGGSAGSSAGGAAGSTGGEGGEAGATGSAGAGGALRSCSEIYGAGPAVKSICGETAEVCAIAFGNQAVTCRQLCESAGGECLGTFNDLDDVACTCEGPVDCDWGALSAVCLCSRGCSGASCPVLAECSQLPLG